MVIADIANDSRETTAFTYPLHLRTPFALEIKLNILVAHVRSTLTTCDQFCRTLLRADRKNTILVSIEIGKYERVVIISHLLVTLIRFNVFKNVLSIFKSNLCRYCKINFFEKKTPIKELKYFYTYDNAKNAFLRPFSFKYPV